MQPQRKPHHEQPQPDLLPRAASTSFPRAASTKSKLIFQIRKLPRPCFLTLAALGVCYLPRPSLYMYLLFYHFRILPRPACITTCLPHLCFINQVPGRGIDTAPFFFFTPRHGTPTMPRPSLNYCFSYRITSEANWGGQQHERSECWGGKRRPTEASKHG